MTDSWHAADAAAAALDNARHGKIRRLHEIADAEAERLKPSFTDGAVLTDFYAYMPAHTYLYVPSREFWPAASLDGRLPRIQVGNNRIKPSAWLDTHRPIEQVTWAPSEPELIHDLLIQISGWVNKPGARVFNLYRAAPAILGDPTKAGPWLDHLETLYPDDMQHLILWMACRLQRPGQKINHALVLGGAPGIGKDTLLRPLRAGVGAWNTQDVAASTFLNSNFNGFARCVLLVISEARDLGEFDRFTFHDHLKCYLAEPPPVLRINEKFMREYYIENVLGVVFTTNHPTDALYLPADDRRHYVTWSEMQPGQFAPDYFNQLHGWLDAGGEGHVVAFLRSVNLVDFDPKAPPKKTPAFWRLVATGEAPESGELRDVLEYLGDPSTVTIEMLAEAARQCGLWDLREELNDRKQRRAIPHKLDRVGYVPVQNPDANDGLFKLAGRRQRIYARRALSLADQIQAARKQAGQSA